MTRDEKKRLENYLKQRWDKCPHCNHDITKSLCKHVEELLPSTTSSPGQYVNDDEGTTQRMVRYTADVEEIPQTAIDQEYLEFMNKERFQDEEEFYSYIDSLMELQEIEKHILYDRVVLKRSYRDIQKHRRITSDVMAISRIYKGLINKLRERIVN